MQKNFRFFWEYEKKNEKWKMGLNNMILDFEGRSPVRSLFYESLDAWFFFF